MSRRLQRDAIVVGGGVVGAACALALADAGLQVALVEAGQPARWSRDQPDLRVFAFAPDNAALLDSLGVWQDILATRAQPYREMRVWDAAGGGELDYVPCLNDHPAWVTALAGLVQRHLQGWQPLPR